MRVFIPEPKFGKHSTRFNMLLTYKLLCSTLKVTTEEADEKVREFAKRERISPIQAFIEFEEIVGDLEASRWLRQRAEYDCTFGY